MIRKQKEIDNDIKVLTGRLESKIEHGVAFEKQNDENIADLNRMLKLLVKEEVFENTLEGKIEILEIDTIKAINILVEALTKETGKEYTACLTNQNSEKRAREKYAIAYGSGLAGIPTKNIVTPLMRKDILNDFASFVRETARRSGVAGNRIAYYIGREIRRRREI